MLSGRYRIVQFIAQGAMGEVYEVEDLELGERIALKTIRPFIAQDVGIIDRFKREILLARKVTHPNVCRIFDLGLHESSLWFLTMELLPGETLADQIRSAGSMSLAEAKPLIEQMVAGLDAAHQVGIIHRDFKSHNVIIVSHDNGKRAVITDFGLARTGMPKSDGISSGIVGTPAYMAPEQVEGKPVSPQSDLYALGVVMFEMATGQLPFTGDSPISAAVRRLQEPPPYPKSLVSNIDPRWNSAILRCMERDPLRRYSRALDIIIELNKQLVPNSIQDQRLSPERVKKDHNARLWRWGGLLACVVPVLTTAQLISNRLNFFSTRTSTATSQQELLSIETNGVHASLPSNSQAVQNYTNGIVALAQADKIVARKALKEAVRLAPNFAAAYAALSETFEPEDPARRETAKRAREVSLGLPPDEKLWIDGIYYQAENDRPTALKIFKRLAALYPNNIDYGLHITSILTDDERYDEARSVIQRLRHLSLPQSDDPRIDIQEVSLPSTLENKRQLCKRAAQKALARGNRALQAFARHCEGGWSIALGDLDSAVSALVDAIELHERLGDVIAHVHALTQLGQVKLLRGELTSSAKIMSEAISVARRNGNHALEKNALLCRANTLINLGLLNEAETDFIAAKSIAEEQPDDVLLIKIKPWILQLRGDLNGARRVYMEETFPLLRRADYHGIRATTLLNAGQLWIEIGELSEGRSLLQEALDLKRSPVINQIEIELAALLIEEGRLTSAEQEARRLNEKIRQSNNASDELAQVATILSIALLQQGRLAEARVEIDQVLGRARTTEDPRVRHAIQTVAGRVRASSDQRHEVDEARQLFETVIKDAQALGLRADELEARLWHGQLELLYGSGSAARVPLIELERQAGSRGYGLLQRKAASLLNMPARARP